MRALLLLLIMSGLAAAQVQVLFTPEPSEVLRSLRPRVGLWSIRACNDGMLVATIAPERVIMAAPSIRFLTAEQAAAVLAQRAKSSTLARVIRYAEWGAMGATLITGSGLVAASSKVVGSIAIGSATARTIADRLSAEVPSIGPLGPQLVEPLQLPSGACVTRVAFSGLMKSPAPVQAVIR